MPDKQLHTTKESRIEKLKSGRGCFNMEGTLVTQIIGGWQFQNINYTEPEQVLEAIDSSLKDLERSVERGKKISESITVPCGGGNVCVNSENIKQWETLNIPFGLKIFS